jgi:hypothetical protein
LFVRKKSFHVMKNREKKYEALNFERILPYQCPKTRLSELEYTANTTRMLLLWVGNKVL